MSWQTTFLQLSEAISQPLAPENVFRRVIALERLRSDRTGQPFSLLIGEADEWTRQEGRAAVVRVLSQRIRATDLLGELDCQRFAVLLPHTGRDAAAAMARQLQRMLGELPMVVTIHVNTYPVDTMPTESTDDVGGAALRELLVIPLPRWKRVLDVAGATMGLIVLAPVLLTIAILVKLTSPGPVLFRQQRAGVAGRPFTLFKFRTMRIGADSLQGQLRDRNEQDGPAFKMRSDPRVTFVGRFLRRSALDELPQLFNVLWGDMTLVGPRPLPLAEAAACRDWEQRRVSVTPGLTCIWQASGRRCSFAEWMRMDLAYIGRRGLATDLKLIAKTIGKVVTFRASH